MAGVELSAGEVAAVSDALSTVTTIVQQSDSATWSAVSASFPLDVLVRLLLESPEARLRREAANTFLELMSGKGYTLVPSEGGAPLPSAEVLGPLFLGPRLASLPATSRTGAEFFDVCQGLLAGGKAAWLDGPALCRSLDAKLRSWEAPITKEDGSDSVLVGVLSTYATLLGLDSAALPLADALALVDHAVGALLLRLPAAALPTGTAASGPAAAGPVCGTPKARAAACSLLGMACRCDGEVGAAVAMRISGHLATFASQTRPQPPTWQAHTVDEDLRSFERPGLNNTANRCYMNSLTQQFAALVGFAEPLMGAPVPESVLAADREEAARKEAEAAAKAKGGGAEEAAGTWECPICTANENEASSQECMVCGSPIPAGVKIVAAGVDPEEARREREVAAKAQKSVLREFQRTLRFLRQGETSCYDAEPLLGCVGEHLGLQFPAEQQNDTKEFMDKLLDRLEMELSDTPAKDLVKESFGATTANIKVRQHDGKMSSRSEEVTTTYTMSLQVEGLGSIFEAMDNFFEASVGLPY